MVRERGSADGKGGGSGGDRQGRQRGGGGDGFKHVRATHSARH